jgi:hypothetical protein
MPGYVDPFANRSTMQEATDDPPDPSSDETVVVIDDDDDLDERDDLAVDLIGLDAIVDDAERGRREAPFADDPAHRVRPV